MDHAADPRMSLTWRCFWSATCFEALQVTSSSYYDTALARRSCPFLSVSQGWTQKTDWLHLQAQAPAPTYLHIECDGAARVPVISLQPLLAIRTHLYTSSKAIWCPALATRPSLMATGCCFQRRVVFPLQRSVHSRFFPTTSWSSQRWPPTAAGMHCQHDCAPGGRRRAARGTPTPLPDFAGPNRQRPCYDAGGCARLICPPAALLLVCCTWLSKAQTSQRAAWRPALVARIPVKNIVRHAGAAARQQHAGFLLKPRGGEAGKVVCSEIAC